MDDELLDLVNEKDEVIGETWKSKANADPKLIHREAAVIIYNKDGRILFQKRGLSKKVSPGLWQVTAAGHVEKGEDPEKTAHRELSEEVGFDTDLKYFDKTLDKRINETRFTYWYVGKFPNGAKIKIQKDEVEDATFFTQEDVERKINEKDFGKTSRKMALKFWQQQQA